MLLSNLLNDKSTEVTDTESICPAVVAEVLHITEFYLGLISIG